MLLYMFKLCSSYALFTWVLSFNSYDAILFFMAKLYYICKQALIDIPHVLRPKMSRKSGLWNFMGPVSLVNSTLKVLHL